MYSISFPVDVGQGQFRLLVLQEHMLLQRHLAARLLQLGAEVQVLAAGSGGALLGLYLQGGIRVLGLLGVQGAGGEAALVALEGGLDLGSEGELDEADALADDLAGPVLVVLDLDVLQALVLGRVPGVQLLPVMRLHQLVLLRNQEQRGHPPQIPEVFLELVVFQGVAHLLVQLVADEGHQGFEEALGQAGPFRPQFFDQLPQVLEGTVQNQSLHPFWLPVGVDEGGACPHGPAPQNHPLHLHLAPQVAGDALQVMGFLQAQGNVLTPTESAAREVEEADIELGMEKPIEILQPLHSGPVVGMQVNHAGV